jgi:3',5'-cyclic AMP phosphodiesterase CpdA
MRIAAIADLHVRATENTSNEEILEQIKKDSVDILVVAGDITDKGLLEEAESAVKILKTLEKPVVAVLGNHDYEG